MLPRIRPFPLLCLLAALAAAPSEAQARDTIHEGMTEAQVVAALGPPALVRRVDDWSYLFYPNGCPVLCGKDDVVFVRGCRVVTAMLLRTDRRYIGTEPRAALAWTEPGGCLPAGGGTPVQTAAAGDAPSPPRGAPPADAPSTGAPPAAAPPAAAEPADAPRPGSDVVPFDAAPRDTTPLDRRRLQAFRDSLRMPRARAVVQAIPAGSISTPTAFGLDQGEAFVGAGFQHRTRYTDDADGAVVAGIGLGSRNRYVGVELAVTSYSTIRGGGPIETGGLSFKVHRSLDERSGVAVGVENVTDWGNPDSGRSAYAVWTRVFRLRPDTVKNFSSLILSLGAGSGRFRFEDDVLDDQQAVNFFGSLGVRASEPVSVVADWTGQDLNLALSITPLRRNPLAVNVGLADLTGHAGDGVRFIASVGYGFLLRRPF